MSEGVFKKSSMACCSLPKRWWVKSGYVRHNQYSKVISEFRSGNTGTGDRITTFSSLPISGPDGRVTLCPGCGLSYNKHYHWVVSCPGLANARAVIMVGDKSLENIFDEMENHPIHHNDQEKLRNFLDTSGDTRRVVVDKAQALDKLRAAFIDLLWKF